jgi:hypothetical protein
MQKESLESETHPLLHDRTYALEIRGESPLAFLI